MRPGHSNSDSCLVTFHYSTARQNFIVMARALMSPMPMTRMPTLVRILVVAASCATPSAVSATDYYVSATGADANPGTSTAAPWRTVQRVNNQHLLAGDRVLFEGGQTFSGSLYFDS